MQIGQSCVPIALIDGPDLRWSVILLLVVEEVLGVWLPVLLLLHEVLLRIVVEGWWVAIIELITIGLHKK